MAGKAHTQLTPWAENLPISTGQRRECGVFPSRVSWTRLAPCSISTGCPGCVEFLHHRLWISFESSHGIVRTCNIDVPLTRCIWWYFETSIIYSCYRHFWRWYSYLWIPMFISIELLKTYLLVVQKDWELKNN